MMEAKAFCVLNYIIKNIQSAVSYKSLTFGIVMGEDGKYPPTKY